MAAAASIMAKSSTKTGSSKEKKRSSSSGSSSSLKKKPSPQELKKQHDAAKHIHQPLVEKAVAALVKYHNEQAMKKQSDGTALIPLLGNDTSIQVQFGLEVAPSGRPSPKPIRIQIPHPLHKVADNDNDDDNEGLEEVDVCLIVKEGSKPWAQEMIAQFPEYMGCVKKVLTLESLRKKYSLYHQRRELLQKYDIFMADDRILPMLTSALGKDFVKAKKLPVPVQLTRKEALPLVIQKNLSATFLTISAGTSISIRAGNTGMPLKKVIENVVAIAENAVDKIPRKWANIRSIAIKTPESTSLPFYNKTPEELLEIAKMAGVQPAFKEIVLDDEEKKEPVDEEAAEKKRKLKAAKSPLVRALKKQKNEEADSDKKKTEKDDNQDLNKAEKKKDKAAKKTKDGDEVQAVKPEKNAEQSVTRSKSAEKDASKAGKKKKREEESEEDKSEEPSPPKKAKSPAKEEKAKKSKSPAKEEKAGGDFIASKKFKGSKKGFVFKAGKQGLGYYKDVKPVVDKMVLQALFRSAEQGGKRGRSKSAEGGKRGRSKSAGKRQGRR